MEVPLASKNATLLLKGEVSTFVINDFVLMKLWNGTKESLAYLVVGTVLLMVAIPLNARVLASSVGIINP